MFANTRLMATTPDSGSEDGRGVAEASSSEVATSSALAMRCKLPIDAV